MSLNVALPEYKYTQMYDLEAFMSMFPDSLITRTYEVTHDTTIPIDNPLVTPDILRLLDEIIRTKDYPYVDIPNAKRALDYLGIDLPDVVYNSKYQDFRKRYPYITLDNIDKIHNYYQSLTTAREMQFPELAQYLLQHSNPDEHIEANSQVFLDIINTKDVNPSFIDIASMIMNLPSIQNKIREEYQEQVDYRDIKDINDIVDTIVDQGYSKMLQAYLNALLDPSSYLIDNLMLRVIDNIIINPSHFADYIQMLISLSPYLSNPEIQLRSRYLYQAFSDVYSGDVKSATKSLSNLGRDIDIIGSSLLYTAVVRNNPQMFNLIINLYKQIFGHDYFAQNMYRLMYNRFLNTYQSQPQIHTPEFDRLVQNNQKL